MVKKKINKSDLNNVSGGEQGVYYTFKVVIDYSKCMYCGYDNPYSCYEVCPSEAFEMLDGHLNFIEDKCINCGTCKNICDAITLVDSNTTN